MGDMITSVPKVSYRKRVFVRAIIATVLVVLVFAFMWWLIDFTVDTVMVSIIKDTAVTAMNARTAESTTFIIGPLADDRVLMVKMVIRGIVYLGLLLTMFAYGMYTKNNPDTLIMSMGTMSKKVMVAAIQEDLRREELISHEEEVSTSNGKKR